MANTRIYNSSPDQGTDSITYIILILVVLFFVLFFAMIFPKMSTTTIVPVQPLGTGTQATPSAIPTFESVTQQPSEEVSPILSPSVETR